MSKNISKYEDFKKLEPFIKKYANPENDLNKDVFLGFIAGIACYPLPLDSDEWTRFIWGEPDESGPKWETENDEYIFNGILLKIFYLCRNKLSRNRIEDLLPTKQTSCKDIARGFGLSMPYWTTSDQPKILTHFIGLNTWHLVDKENWKLLGIKPEPFVETIGDLIQCIFEIYQEPYDIFDFFDAMDDESEAVDDSTMEPFSYRPEAPNSIAESNEIMKKVFDEAVNIRMKQ